MAANILINDLEKIIIPRGWYFERHRGPHIIYRHPCGAQMAVNSSKVAGRSRVLKNLIAQFKRAERGIRPGVN